MDIAQHHSYVTEDPSVKKQVLEYIAYWAGHAVASLYCGDISHHRSWELPRPICRHSHSMTTMAICHIMTAGLLAST